MLQSITKTATFRQSQITIMGTIINGILGAVFYILLARFLGPIEFGLFTVSIATLTLIADSVDFGTNTGLLRHIPQSLVADKSKALKFLKLGLEFKILVWIAVFIIGFLISPAVASLIFKKYELVNPLRLVMVGVGGALLFSFATSSLQAFQKYFIWSFVNIITNFLRLIFIIFLFYVGQLNLSSGLVIFILLPFFGFSLTLIFLPSREMFEEKNEFSVAKQFFKYNLWVAVFLVIASVSSRMDTFLTARLLTNFELGIYGAANQLVQVVPQLVGALGMVAAPKFASFRNDQDMVVYLKKLQLFVLGLSALGLITIPIFIYIIPILFGVAYITAVAPFILLLVAMLVFLISVPIHNSIIFYFARPDIFIWVSVGHLAIISLLGYFLISSFGLIGAGTTVLVGTIFNLLAPASWFFYKLRKGSN